uniref:Uncharacterized protein n=1 Tax=Triticum urartu TaxID=4572 RepID=A0A8R7U1L2_TRIUA
MKDLYIRITKGTMLVSLSTGNKPAILLEGGNGRYKMLSGAKHINLKH